MCLNTFTKPTAFYLQLQCFFVVCFFYSSLPVEPQRLCWAACWKRSWSHCQSCGAGCASTCGGTTRTCASPSLAPGLPGPPPRFQTESSRQRNQGWTGILKKLYWSEWKKTLPPMYQTLYPHLLSNHLSRKNHLALDMQIQQELKGTTKQRSRVPCQIVSGESRNKCSDKGRGSITFRVFFFEIMTARPTNRQAWRLTGKL